MENYTDFTNKLRINCKNRKHTNISEDAEILAVEWGGNTIEIDCSVLRMLLLENCLGSSVILYNVQPAISLEICLFQTVKNIKISTESEENKITLSYQCPLEEIHSDIIFDTIEYDSLDDSLNTTLLSKQCALMYAIDYFDLNELCFIKKPNITRILSFEPQKGSDRELTTTNQFNYNLRYDDDNFRSGMCFDGVEKGNIVIEPTMKYSDITFKNSYIKNIEIRNFSSYEPVLTDPVIQDLYLKNVKSHNVWVGWVKNAVVGNCTLDEFSLSEPYFKYKLRLSNCTIGILWISNNTEFNIIDCTIGLLDFRADDNIHETNLTIPPKTFKKCSMSIYSPICNIKSSDVEEFTLIGQKSKIRLFGYPKKILIDNMIGDDVTINDVLITNSNYLQIHSGGRTEYVLENI